VIQFALLYGLGFLSATLLVLVLAPAVHRRVVRYTENRLKATMPISPAEVRAQRDMARAVYAAENARTRQELTEERDRHVALQLRFDRLSEEAAHLHASHHEMQIQVSDMSVEAADLRSRLRREEGLIQQLKQSLATVEETVATRNAEIETLRKRIQKLTGDLDHLNIDLSTRDSTADSLKQRASALREEREALRTDLKLMTTRAKDAEQRLMQEEARAARLEEKLMREIAQKADTQEALDRRLQEIEQLRGRSGAGDGEWREPVTGSYPLPRKKIAAVEQHALSSRKRRNGRTRLQDSQTPPEDRNDETMRDLSQMQDDIRARSAALGAELSSPAPAQADETLRRELATIAADMVALTAVAEGPTSPIIAILDKDAEARHDTDETDSHADEPDLASRARQSLARIHASDA
jgi:chromosome segregation ATPase